jgi:ABC-type antimicrobial peptide transport system permease subunit
MYFNYTSRSLLRGGQRTLLAIFCVAVGVMAIVALQLVGSMLQSSLSSNTRNTNGGDVAITSQNTPFKSSDLSYFSQLKQHGTITNYTATMSANGTLSATAQSFQSFTVEAVQPDNYPIVAQPTFTSPSNGSISTLLTNNQVVVTQSFLDATKKKVGDTISIYIKTATGSAESFQVQIAGVVSNTGVFAQASSLVLISQHDYQAAFPKNTVSYNVVDVTTANTTQTNAVVKDVSKQFPLATTQTVADALKTQQSSIDSINKFLEIAGLLALLIGGVGIVNTMQVLLSRRRTEIAMLKTNGYRRTDLYLLFGLEAGMLGLVGGVVGAVAATDVSYIVRSLVQNLGIAVPFSINPWLLVSGVAIGLVTALIFGLMPVVQAANIRPLNVIRDMSESKGVSSFAMTAVLLIILSVLFCGLAIVILNNDVLLGIEAVYGTFAFLLVLSGVFGLITLAISKLPVPERFSFVHLLLVLASLAVAGLAYLVLPIFGILFAAFALLGLFVVLMPRTWKVSTKMALRNIGRQRTRTTTTMTALFIGVFTVGLVLALGQDLQTEISNAFVNNAAYNVTVQTSGKDTTTLSAKLNTVPGLLKSRIDTSAQVMPTMINGQPFLQTLPKQADDRQTVLGFLSMVEGYNLSQGTPSATISKGRNLNASDAGTNNILVSDLLTSNGPFHMSLKVGDTLTFASMDGKTTRTMTIVGITARTSSASFTDGVLASSQVVTNLATAKTGVTTITYLKIDNAQLTKALNKVGAIVPNAQVQSSADIAAYVGQMLNNVLDILVAIASLSVIAGIIIIANAVALAMLERRRELGILKSVGYTRSIVLSEVLIENGVVAATGALLASLLVAGAIVLLGNLLFNMSFSISPLIVLSMIGGAALLAMLTAALVAWGPAQVRPLEVLRYE